MFFSDSRSSRLQLQTGLAFAAALACVAVAAGEDAKVPMVHYSAIRSGGGGLHTYIPEKWGVIALDVTNPLDEPRELLSTTYIDNRPTLQYGRRIWVPARSRLKTWHPVLLPKLLPDKGGKFEFHSLIPESGGAGESLTREDTGQLLHSGTFPAQGRVPVTGMIETLEPPSPDDVDWAYDLVVAVRCEQRLGRRLDHLGDHFFAPDDVGLALLDHLVIADDRVLDDPAGLAAIRRWVHGGGRLWVMAGRVRPQVLERILGDECTFQVVDRVGLTTVRIEPIVELGMPAPVETEYEQPVDLVRVVAGGVDVSYTVNGWPAAFWKPLGAGKILVTTLAPEGWMRARRAGDPPPSPTTGPEGPSDSVFFPLPPMAEMATALFQRKTERKTIAQALEPQAGQYVGYSIPSRGLIVGLLAGLAGAVTAAGVWLARRGALEHLGWLSPGLALAIAGVLLVAGGRNRHAIPALAAGVTFVEAIPGTDDVRSEGAVAFYNPEAGPAVVGSVRGGRLIPDMTGLEGTTRRMIWTDLDAWHWENLTLGDGQRMGQFMQSGTLSVRVEARATPDHRGLAGRITLPGATDLGDAVLATRFGRIGVAIKANGQFEASADDVFAADQFLGAGLLEDEQDRRRETYRRVLPEYIRTRESSRPLVFFWARSNSGRFQFDEGRKLLGSSLYAVPLTLERPVPGTVVRLPAPLLPFRKALQPDGTPSSPMWDNRTNEFQKRDKPGSLWLNFRLPAELVPVELTRARLTVQVTGPVGRFEVLGLRNAGRGTAALGRGAGKPAAEARSIEVWRDPVGSRTFEIVESDVLQTTDEGGLILGFLAGDPDRPELTLSREEEGTKVNYWRIEQVALELVGTIAAP
jgi:hypothetical protein